jgi:hypothetical protein
MSDLAPLSTADIAARCREYAMKPTTENMAAVVLLLAANQLEWLADRTVQLAHANEVLEARQA